MAKLAFQHLDHEPFAAILDTLLEEGLDLIRGLTVGGIRILELKVDRLEMLPEELPPLNEVLLQERLCPRAIQAEREHAKRHHEHVFVSDRWLPTVEARAPRDTHLAVQVEQVECKQTDADFDIFHFDVLPFSPAQFLERK